MIRIFFLFFFLGIISLGNSQGYGPEMNLANQYFMEGDYVQAHEYYEKCYKQNDKDFFIIQRIFECYLNKNLTKEGVLFIDKAVKKINDLPQAHVLRGWAYSKSDDLKSAEQIWNDLIYKKLKTQNDFATAASYFGSFYQPEFSVKTYLQGRKILKNNELFLQELGNLYQMQAKYPEAIREWITLYFQKPEYLNYIKSQLLAAIKPENAEQIESALLGEVSKYPQEPEIRELLIEMYLQTENFDEALLQAMAADKVFKESGERIFQLGKSFQANEKFELSNKAFDYILQKYPDGMNYYPAFVEKVVNLEMETFSSKPIDTLKIRTVVNTYNSLLQKFGRGNTMWQAVYRKAKLCAFYLNEPESARIELESLKEINIPPRQKAEINILLGDIYLMQGDYLNARRNYYLVEEQFKEDQLGSIAKFKDAKLSYYKGDFEIAQARLKTLKENTSNDISNDAIQLNLIIQDNTVMDSTKEALVLFAQAQLLHYCHNNKQALIMLDSIFYKFPGHTLSDDIWWEKTLIFKEDQNYSSMLMAIDHILLNYNTGIYGDDALFYKAEYYDYYLNSVEKATELYLDFLMKYPGSLYKVQIRKRIRELRGEKAIQG